MLFRSDEGVRGLEGDGVEGGYVLTLEGHQPMDLHVGVALLGQARQLETYIVVLIHHLGQVRRRGEGGAERAWGWVSGEVGG